MMTMKEEARQHAKVVRATVRVELRRWLRRNVPREGGKLPGHMYIYYDTDQLMKLVREYGGTPEAIVFRARQRAVRRIAERKGL